MPDILVTTPSPRTPTGPINGSKLSMFAAFAENPSGVRFENQEPDESILLFVRQHIITNVPWIIITILLLIAPIVVVPFFSLFFPFSFEVSAGFATILLLFYYLVVLGYAFISFLHWFYNIGIVTQRNVIDIDYSDIINVHVSATKASQIEDVSYKQGGFLRTLFNFGDVYVQTAATQANFEYNSVPNPGKIVDIIHDLIGRRNA